MGSASVSVIIPVFNEAENIGQVIREIASIYPDYEIIVVNDGSTDETARVAKEAGAIVYSHPYNIGNGAAVKSGIRIASGEILVFMDGEPASTRLKTSRRWWIISLTTIWSWGKGVKGIMLPGAAHRGTESIIGLLLMWPSSL